MGVPVYCGGADPRDGRSASDACPAACGVCSVSEQSRSCVDDPAWRKSGHPDQGCDTYAFGEVNGGHAAWQQGQASPFCFVAGEDGRSATEACGCTCSDDGLGGFNPPPPPPPPQIPSPSPPPSPPPLGGQCDLAARVTSVNSACCGPTGCAPGGPVPTVCGHECASIFLAFWQDCSSAVERSGDFQLVSQSTARSFDRPETL